jgi:hypothetical protein
VRIRDILKITGLSTKVIMYDAGIKAMDTPYAEDIDITMTADFVFTGDGLREKQIRGLHPLENEVPLYNCKKRPGHTECLGRRGI